MAPKTIHSFTNDQNTVFGQAFGSDTTFNSQGAAGALSGIGSAFSGFTNFQAGNASAAASVASIGDVDRMLALNLGEIGKDLSAITKQEEFNVTQNAKRKRVANEITGFNRRDFGQRRAASTDEFSLKNQLSDLDRTRISTDLTEALTKLDLSNTARTLKRDRTLADQRVEAGAGGVRQTGSQRLVREDQRAEAQLDLDSISAERTGTTARAGLNQTRIDKDQALTTLQHEFELDQFQLQEEQAELELVNAIEDIDLDLETLGFNAEIARDKKRTEAKILTLNAQADKSNLSANASAAKKAGKNAAISGIINTGISLFGAF